MNLARSIELEVDEHELAIPLDLEDGRTVGFQLIQAGAKMVQTIDRGAIQTVDYVSGDQGRVTATRIRSSGNHDYSGRNSIQKRMVQARCRESGGISFTAKLLSIILERKDKDDEQSSLLQQVRGIDHLRIAVRDLEKAKDQYRDVLGFNLPAPGKKGVHPTGSENSSAHFVDNYLELIAVHDRDKVLRNRPWLIDFLQKREGAQSLALEVSSAQETTNFLRAHEFSVTDPVPGTIMKEGDKESPPPMWWLVDFKEPVLPGGVVFFIQYAHNESASGGTSNTVPQPPNTSQGISAVWMVVADLKQAVKAYASVGLPPKRTLGLPYLGAEAHEIDAGRGSILLVQPIQADGYAASFIKQAGEGIMGVSLAVANLSTTETLLAKNIGHAFAEYGGAYGKSILIPGDVANGLWIEMHENS